MEQSTTAKVCTRCGKELPLTAFYRNPKGKFGCTSECRECHKIQMRKYLADKRRTQVPPQRTSNGIPNSMAKRRESFSGKCANSRRS